MLVWKGWLSVQCFTFILEPLLCLFIHIGWRYSASTNQEAYAYAYGATFFSVVPTWLHNNKLFQHGVTCLGSIVEPLRRCRNLTVYSQVNPFQSIFNQLDLSDVVDYRIDGYKKVPWLLAPRMTPNMEDQWGSPFIWSSLGHELPHRDSSSPGDVALWS